jgi:hypothetical protein
MKLRHRAMPGVYEMHCTGKGIKSPNFTFTMRVSERPCINDCTLLAIGTSTV